MTGLPIDIPPAVIEFCRRNKIRRLALFGSVLREDFNSESDVDVLVEFEPDAHIGLRFFTLESELSDLFGRKVDLNTPNFISAYFRASVLEQAEDLYVAT